MFEFQNYFRFSSQAATCSMPTCLPHKVEASHCLIFIAEGQTENCKYQYYLYSPWFDLTENQTKVYRSVADVYPLDQRPVYYGLSTEYRIAIN